MFDDFYTLASRSIDLHPFIKSLETWQHNYSSSYLIYCNYNAAKFRESYFSDFAINIPTQIARSVPKRKSEFLAGRIAAKFALKQFNDFSYFNALNVDIGSDRSPIWPQNYQGSISHTNSSAISLVAKTNKHRLIGIDIENSFSPIEIESIAAYIHTQKELLNLTVQGISTVQATAIIFSAKECIFKAVYPKVGKYFGFEIAHVIHFDLNQRHIDLCLDSDFSQNYSIAQNYRILFSFRGNELISILHSETN